jgi:hypothetical protein
VTAEFKIFILPADFGPTHFFAQIYTPLIAAKSCSNDVKWQDEIMQLIIERSLVVIN